MMRVAIFTAIIMSASPATAGNLNDEYDNEQAMKGNISVVYRAAVYSSQAIMNRFREIASTDRERLVFSKVRVTIDREQTGLFNVYATMEKSTPVINVGIGYLMFSSAVNHASAYEHMISVRKNELQNESRPIKYAEYLANTLMDNERRTKNAEPALNYDSYLVWIGLSRKDGELASKELENDTYLEMLSSMALGFVLGHELGHHVLGHTLLGRAANRAEEILADAYGADLTLRAGGDPTMIGPTFTLFSEIESHYTTPEAERSHPAAACRLWRIGEHMYGSRIRGELKSDQSGVTATDEMRRKYAELEQMAKELCH
jgi:hypothetical protein